MSDHLLIVALLKEYAYECSITRPEVNKILGKKLPRGAQRVGYVEGVHHRNRKEIGDWPKIDPTRKNNRRCQWPLDKPGTELFHLCGKMRKPGDLLLCEEHAGKVWKPE